MGANKNSIFLYMKTKGEVEEAVTAIGLKNLIIMKPGLITDRDNDFRFGEALGSWVPFINKISGIDLAKSIFYHSLEQVKNP